MGDFNARVQSLPLELFNYVSNLTFTAACSPRTINEDYKPPHLLQIDRHSRMLFAKSYYGSAASFCMSLEEWTAWIPSLERKHAEQIGEVRLDPYAHYDFEEDLDLQCFVGGLAIEDAAQEMRLLGHRAKEWDKMFKVHICFPDGERKWLNYRQMRELEQ